MKVLAMLPVPVVLLGLAPLAAASWTADFKTGDVYEDNLSFASMVRDIKATRRSPCSARRGRPST